MSGAVDLTGLWTGSYGYRGVAGTDNGFLCTMTDNGGRLSGSISEPDEGAPGRRASAGYAGARNGRRVVFTKIYDGGSSVGHRVRYDGVLSSDGLMIDGRWSHPTWSGPFVMQRQRAAEVNEETIEAADIRVPLEPVR